MEESDENIGDVAEEAQTSCYRFHELNSIKTPQTVIISSGIGEIKLWKQRNIN